VRQNGNEMFVAFRAVSLTFHGPFRVLSPGNCSSFEFPEYMVLDDCL